MCSSWNWSIMVLSKLVYSKCEMHFPTILSYVFNSLTILRCRCLQHFLKSNICLFIPSPYNAIAPAAVFFIQGILCVSHGKHIELWNTNTWEKLSTFRGHGDRVEAVQLKIYDASKPTGMVLSGSKDQTVKYWDITRWEVCMEVA